ncbi:Uncharacterised protein [Kluyvera cryocrescens]|nr:Uncharacterised protein [Kluyvera cryocrescens]
MFVINENPVAKLKDAIRDGAIKFMFQVPLCFMILSCNHLTVWLLSMASINNIASLSIVAQTKKVAFITKECYRVSIINQ